MIFEKFNRAKFQAYADVEKELTSVNKNNVTHDSYLQIVDHYSLIIISNM